MLSLLCGFGSIVNMICLEPSLFLLYLSASWVAGVILVVAILVLYCNGRKDEL